MLDWAYVGLAAALGLIFGSFLNVVIARVPVGESLAIPSHCPRCSARIKARHNIPLISWFALGRKCASCEAPISARYPLVEVVTALAFGGIALAAVQSVQTSETSVATAIIHFVAFAYFAAVSIALACIDIDTHRLPNVMTLPSYLVMVVLLGIAALTSGDGNSALRAVIGACALFAFYALLRLIRPDGMGGGDVKLAGLLGLTLGYLGWGTLIVGAVAAFIFGGVYGVLLILFRKAGRASAIPFGPWMLAGAWFAIIFGDTIAHWYLGILNL